MNQKGFANIVLIVLVVILAGAAGYFFFTRNPVQQEQSTSLSPSAQSSTSQAPTPTPTSGQSQPSVSELSPTSEEARLTAARDALYNLRDYCHQDGNFNKQPGHTKVNWEAKDLQELQARGHVSTIYFLNGSPATFEFVSKKELFRPENVKLLNILPEAVRHQMYITSSGDPLYDPPVFYFYEINMQCEKSKVILWSGGLIFPDTQDKKEF